MYLRSNLHWFCGLLLLASAGGLVARALPPSNPGEGVFTNVAELRRVSTKAENVSCTVDLSGTVLWISREMGELILQDGSGGICVQNDLREQPLLHSGDRVRISGSAIAGKGGLRQLLIDNDGRHVPVELAQAVYLPSGRVPFRLDYFNGVAGFELNLEYQGPNIPRQRIPDTALFCAARKDAVGENVGVDRGLNYRCYEGNWQLLPDFPQLTPVKTGTVSNLDLGVRTRDQYFGVQFAGDIELPCAGVFTFWLRSDDGSRLYLGAAPLSIAKLGSGARPAAHAVAAGQSLRAEDECCWAETEGTVLSLSPEPGGPMALELGTGTNQMRLEVANASGTAPPSFSTIRAAGICLGIAGPGGGRVAGRLLVPSFSDLTVLKGPGTKAIAPSLMTLAQVRTFAAAGQRNPGAIRLQGVALTADPGKGFLTLADSSGVALVQLDLEGWSMRPGQRVALSGNCLADGSRLYFRQTPLVDNDGVHNLTEKSASVFLTAGKHPVHLCCFNREPPDALDVYWQPPGLPREKIPENRLSHASVAPDGSGTEWVPGLQYQTYEGRWEQVPATLRLEPVKQGLANIFDGSLATRPQSTALEFSGYVDVLRDGVYSFTTVSKDGSLLYVDAVPTRLEVLGTGPLPPAATIAPRQILRENQQYRWAHTEGRVTFASERAGVLTLELNAGTGRMRVEVADASGASPQLLLNSRVRATGICQADYTTEGQRVAGTLLVPSASQLDYLEMAANHWADYPVSPIGRLLETTVNKDFETVVHVRGKIVAQAEDGSLVLEDESGQVLLRTSQPPPESDSLEIETLGRLCREGTNTFLCGGFYRDAAILTNESAGPLPVLTSIEQVKRLTRREANRNYPVKIRGVITSPLTAGCFVQDNAWAIYVRWLNTIKGDFPRAGEYWEIEGTTYVEFAPNIRARRAVKLGTAVMPEPFRPTWDQLINGSLDIRYVEIQGVVIDVDDDGLSLLTRDGRIKVQITEIPPQTLKLYLNAVVRLRGCLVPEKSANAQKVELGRIGLANCSVTVDEPAPADPFALPLKRIGELLLFDPRASSIQRVKLSGQILHERHGEYFLVEGGSGLRFFLHTRAQFRPGDLVEVVGFPDLGGPSPALREAMARDIGHADLPAPEPLNSTNLLSRRYDSTLVRLEATLANVSLNRADQLLEVQAGTRGFVARLDLRRGRLPDLAPGSLLQLSGVYAGQGGDIASGRDIDSFELLLNGPGNLKVLRRPSWWTGQHALMVLGGMTLIILAALIWITLLQRQVEERSQLLAAAVRRQEQAERQRALEQERARISRDLHDDLGATLTQIRLLSAVESRDAQVPSSTRSRLSQVTEKSRQMVASLDEIVWAVNPANDSIPSLATYLCQAAEEFFRPTGIRCRLDVPDALPGIALTSEVRHNLYLAAREALNNIAKHSEATEVWLRIQCNDHLLLIMLQDNGRGFSFPADAFAGDGLANMRSRLERIGGHFECQTQSGAGTICRISLPLAQRPVTATG